MAKRVEFDLYAEQDETTTRLMLHVDGDPPVALVSYARNQVEASAMTTFMELKAEGDPIRCDHWVGVQISMVKKPVEG